MKSMTTFQSALVTALLIGASALAQSPSDDFAALLVDAAMERLAHDVAYDGSYRDSTIPAGMSRTTSECVQTSSCARIEPWGLIFSGPSTRT